MPPRQMPPIPPPPREVHQMKEFIIPPVGTSPITGIQGTINWGGINRPDQRSRWVINDADLDDMINMLPQGVQLQQIPYKSATLATVAASIIWMQAYVLSGVPYLYCLCADGHIYQVSTVGVITDINPAGGFSTVPPCDITDWECTTILITDPAAAKIYSWNGSAFATVFSSQPATSISTFGNRLWMANGLSITWTQGNTFNSLAGDAGSFVITDEDANSNIVHMFSTVGSLMIFGTAWIKSISGLQSFGSPAVLIFNLTTIAQGAALILASPYCIYPFSNYLYFANAYGLFQMSGSALGKLSIGLDGFFQNLNFSNTSFSVAYGEIYGTPCLFWQAYYNGDNNVPAGYTLLATSLQTGQPTQWFRVVQGTITFIAGVAPWSGSNVPVVYGTDGTNIFSLFTNNTTSYSFTINTKIWDVTGSKIDYRTWDALALFCPLSSQTSITVTFIGTNGLQVGNTNTQTASTGGTGTLIWLNNSNTVMTWVNNTSAVLTWLTGGLQTGGYFIFQYKIGFDSRGLGLNITGTGIGTILQSIVLGYRETDASFGP